MKNGTQMCQEFQKKTMKWFSGQMFFLEKISNGKPQIIVEFSDSDEDNTIYVFRMTGHDEDGASYCEVHNEVEPIWLCNVAHEIFIEHPAEIFITDILEID